MAFNGYCTATEIADQLGVASHKVTYVIKSRGITASLVVGRVRLFSEAVAKRIAGELKRIDDAARGDDSVAKCTVI